MFDPFRPHYAQKVTLNGASGLATACTHLSLLFVTRAPLAAREWPLPNFAEKEERVMLCCHRAETVIIHFPQYLFD
jgi:hypothetical protein